MPRKREVISVSSESLASKRKRTGKSASAPKNIVSVSFKSLASKRKRTGKTSAPKNIVPVSSESLAAASKRKRTGKAPLEDLAARIPFLFGKDYIGGFIGNNYDPKIKARAMVGPKEYKKGGYYGGYYDSFGSLVVCPSDRYSESGMRYSEEKAEEILNRLPNVALASKTMAGIVPYYPRHVRLQYHDIFNSRSGPGVRRYRSEDALNRPGAMDIFAVDRATTYADIKNAAAKGIAEFDGSGVKRTGKKLRFLGREQRPDNERVYLSFMNQFAPDIYLAYRRSDNKDSKGIYHLTTPPASSPTTPSGSYHGGSSDEE